MTEKERIEFAAGILQKYGVPIDPNNEILPLMLSIKDMQDQCTAAIKAALAGPQRPAKVVQINAARHAILYGFASWGIGATLAGIGILVLAINFATNSAQQKDFERTKALYTAMQADIEKVNDLGFLKTVDIKEDATGKYFTLQNAAGKHESQAGKDFFLIQDGKAAKIYTAYFK